MPADLTAMLERIEQLLSSENSPIARRAMVAIYILWHQVMTRDVHRPRAAEIIEGFATELEAPSIEAFAVRLLLGADIDWATDQFDELVDRRRRDLERGQGQPLPPRFDTALLVGTARLLWDDGDQTAGRDRLAQTVESLPGHQPLLVLEQSVSEGNFQDFDLRRFVLGGDDWLAAESHIVTEA